MGGTKGEGIIPWVKNTAQEHRRRKTIGRCFFIDIKEFIS